MLREASSFLIQSCAQRPAPTAGLAFHRLGAEQNGRRMGAGVTALLGRTLVRPGSVTARQLMMS